MYIKLTYIHVHVQCLFVIYSYCLLFHTFNVCVFFCDGWFSYTVNMYIHNTCTMYVCCLHRVYCVIVQYVFHFPSDVHHYHHVHVHLSTCTCKCTWLCFVKGESCIHVHCTYIQYMLSYTSLHVLVSVCVWLCLTHVYIAYCT